MMDNFFLVDLRNLIFTEQFIDIFLELTDPMFLKKYAVK